LNRSRVVGELGVLVALSRRSIFQTFRRTQYMAPVVVFPTLFLLLNTGGAGRAVDLPGFPAVHGFLDFQLSGAMMQSTMLAGVSGGIALALDIEMGFMDRLVAAPISRFSMVLGRLAATGVIGVVAGIWFLAGGLLFGAHVAGGILGGLVVVGLCFLSALAFGGFAAALALGSGRASTVQGIFPLVFVILFLSSAFFPREMLLEPAKTIADLNPMSFIAEGIRDPVVSGVSADRLGKALASIGLVGLIGLAMSAVALRSRLRSG
jgi:ABC-2 type transport system permease protein